MFFTALEQLYNFIWEYIGFSLIIATGAYFTIISRSFQLRRFPAILRHLLSSFKPDSGEETGLHPLKTLVTALGGSIGLGNVVGICTAIQIGGPGALFWTWVTGFLGMLLIYSEVYLGMVYRVSDPKGGFSGGPMYFLSKAFKSKKLIPVLAALFLCIYGVEIFMFNVVSDSVSTNWHLNKTAVAGGLLLLVLFATHGGIKRVSKICTTIVPIFLGIYLLMNFWVLLQNLPLLPAAFAMIVKSAFTSQAAIGGFAGSTVMLTIAMGISRGAYAGDIGIGYNSVIHAETSSPHPHKQASLTIFGVFLSTFVVCTISTLLVLITGAWSEPIDVTLMVQAALSRYFPFMDYFMPIFLFLLGYLTITTYFMMGQKCARFLSPKHGKKFYYLYAAIALPLFTFVNATQAFIVMSLTGALLLVMNLIGIFLLRKEIRFEID